jgi:hypothetical protein
MRPGFGNALVWLSVLGACGGSGGGVAASSGLSANKKIGSLADDEVRTLCEWGNSLSDTGLSDDQVCTYNALLSNSTAECEQRRDACLKQTQMGSGPGLLGVRVQDCSHKTTEAVPAGCNATVEALENCQRDLIDAMVTDAMRASCNTLGVVWTSVPASCPKDVLTCTRLITEN